MCELTIFTPTYNRAYILGELYQSLREQTSSCFEWLIVDDGSTDDTEKLVSKWMLEETPFSIRYYKKENGGKHRAINYGVPYARGKYFFIVDSDDQLTTTAVETIRKQMASLPVDAERKYAGICNCRGYSLTEIMGTSFEGEYIDCTSLERVNYGITGDKAEVFFTDVLRKYPFPEFEGEKFITECVVWDRMAADGYLVRYYNVITYLCEYRNDGLTTQGMDLYYRNPRGYGYYLKLARMNKKYPKSLSDYYDAECYWHWRTTMSAKQIAELIGVSLGHLLFVSMAYKMKEMARAIRSRLVCH